MRVALNARWGGRTVAIGGKGRGNAKTSRGIASRVWSVLVVVVTWSEARARAGGA